MTKESQASSGGPSLAVVICTRDRPDALLETLDSIWRQTRLPDELILIDDGQLPEGVRDRIAARCRELGVAWQFERSRRGGLTASRNQAADLARSDILEYLDDDVTCDTGFLAEIVRVMSDPRVAGATAAVREPVFETRSGRLYQFGYRLAGWWKVRPRGRPAAEKTPGNPKMAGAAPRGRYPAMECAGPGGQGPTPAARGEGRARPAARRLAPAASRTGGHANRVSGCGAGAVAARLAPGPAPVP